MRIDVESITDFDQEDANEYALRLTGTDGGDDDSFVLWLDTVEAVRLYNLVGKVLGEYVATMKQERAAYDAASPVERVAVMGSDNMDEVFEDCGYDVSNPKHPRYHDTMSSVWDSREGK